MGQAKYAEDFRAEGMLFCKLLLSPLPHARVRGIDVTGALAMPGVKAILTADDLPAPLRRWRRARERALTNEPHYQGEPVRGGCRRGRARRGRGDREDRSRVGAAAVRRRSARKPAAQRPERADAGQRVVSTGSGARARRAPRSRRSNGARPISPTRARAVCRWAKCPSNGASAISRRRSRTRRSCSTRPSSCSPRRISRWNRAARWRTGATASCYLHASTQSVIRTVDGVASWLGIDPAEVVLISEYCGGGFGSKGGGPISMAIPALLAKKANAPVMMRVSREEEHFIGRARTNMTGRAKVGFRKDGRIAGTRSLHRAGQRLVRIVGRLSFGRQRRLAALPADVDALARRERVSTNTPPRSQQRSPGRMQANGMMESAITKAAKQLGIDQVEIRKINSPRGQGDLRRAARRRTRALT